MLGRTLGGRYYVTQHLGGGGFGQTFLAVDHQLPGQPFCVVKQLQPQSSNSLVLQTAKRLFDVEAEVLHRLGSRHDQIPQLFAHFEEKQDFYLVQEFIEGTSLSKEILPGQPWSERRVIDLLKDILEVLSFAHWENVIHRDVKPENLIRRKQDSKIVLIDFGAVKEIIAQTTFPQGGTNRSIVIGTPGYMPSEQAAGRPKRSSDIYAVGIVGIQALTGLLPQQLPEDPDTGEILWRDRVQVSPEFAAVLDKMVRSHFNERYSSAQEALQALDNLPSSTLPPTVPSVQVQNLLATTRSPLSSPSLSNRSVGWNFWLQFVMANYLGFVVDTIGAIVIVLIVFAAIYSFDPRFASGLSENESALQTSKVVIESGSVLGVGTALFQWFVLRKRVPGIILWIPVSILTSTLVGVAEMQNAINIWSAAIFGATSGTARWAVIKEKTPRAIWLVPWFAIALVAEQLLEVSSTEINAQTDPWWAVWLSTSGWVWLSAPIYGGIMTWILRCRSN